MLNMNKKPIQNGLLASTYILLIASVMNFATRFSDKPDSFLAPMLFISIFTFSAAVMGYLFVFEPIQLLIAGKKQQAVNFFLQTLGVFGIITVIISIVVFSGLF